jgi:hypothetical protein
VVCGGQIARHNLWRGWLWRGGLWPAAKHPLVPTRHEHDGRGAASCLCHFVLCWAAQMAMYSCIEDESET